MTDSGLLLLPLGDTHTRSAHDDVEVHSEDSDSGVVLDSEINVLLDSESEVPGLIRRRGGRDAKGGKTKGQLAFEAAPGRSSSTSMLWAVRSRSREETTPTFSVIVSSSVCG